MKTFILAASLLAITSAIPASADNMMMPCTNANIHKTEMMAMGMTKPAQHDAMMMGMKHVDMAKMDKKHGMKHECMMELDQAMKAMHG
jgi:hypothetical protein